MPSLVPLIESPSEMAELSELSNAALRRELTKTLTVTAQNLVRLAAIWCELDRRGDDMSDLRGGLCSWMPLIGTGRLAAEAVVAFASKPWILKAIEGVSLGEQRRLAKGGKVTVYSAEKSEEMQLAAIPVRLLTCVISDGIVHSESEQRMQAEARNISRRESVVAPKHTVKVDRSRGMISIGNLKTPVAPVIAALAAAAGAGGVIIDSVERPAKTIVGKVTDEEKERLKAAGKAHGLEEWEMVRRAVVAMWLL